MFKNNPACREFQWLKSVGVGVITTRGKLWEFCCRIVWMCF